MCIRILLIIIIIILLCIHNNTLDQIIEPHINICAVNTKPYLWTYWDTMPGKTKPHIMKLCNKTIHIHCSKSFNIINLNKTNIDHYLPELKKIPSLQKINDFSLPHKTDVYRVLLLYKYGGLYLDADIIVLKDLYPIIEKLDKYDYVGFGCTGVQCNSQSLKPSNWAMAARPGSLMMRKIINKMIHIFDNDLFKNNSETDQKMGSETGYHSIGKLLIWETIQELRKMYDYQYYHYDNVDGTRDKYMRWVDNQRLFSSSKIEYLDENEIMFVVFYNNILDDNIRKLSTLDLLNSNTNISKFLRKGLCIDKKITV